MYVTKASTASNEVDTIVNPPWLIMRYPVP